MNKKRENLWNKPTPEQAQILSPVAMIQGNGNGFKGSSKGKGGKGSKNSSNETNNSRSKKKDRGVKQWMLEAPKDGAPKSITKNKKEYHWCPKCVKDKGQWVRHNPSDHLENFKTKKKSDNNGRGSSGTSKAKGKKSSNASRGGPLAVVVLQDPVAILFASIEQPCYQLLLGIMWILKPSCLNLCREKNRSEC